MFVFHFSENHHLCIIYAPIRFFSSPHFSITHKKFSSTDSEAVELKHVRKAISTSTPLGYPQCQLRSRYRSKAWVQRARLQAQLQSAPLCNQVRDKNYHTTKPPTLTSWGFVISKPYDRNPHPGIPCSILFPDVIVLA